MYSVLFHWQSWGSNSSVHVVCSNPDALNCGNGIAGALCDKKIHKLKLENYQKQNENKYEDNLPRLRKARVDRCHIR